MNKKTVVAFLIGLIISSVSMYLFMAHELLAPNAELSSRKVMESAMQIVREKKPTPPQSSRFYAVVTRNYYENPAGEYSTSTLIDTLAQVVTGDQQEIKERPVGDAYWTSLVAPFSPNAGSGERFIIDSNFIYTVPEPPLFKSESYMSALKEVAEASLDRTPEQGAAINFWGGIPGTEAPAGIWQNRLWNVSKKYRLDDEKYAYAQMILAESVADAFMECWKVKYQYWTKRPDMVDATIQTAMPNPPFPSYVSGHSTISFTAATVLGVMFPQDAATYLENAEEAKNSRLWAGIHFSYDNEEGKILGTKVGEYIIKKLRLTQVQ